VVLVIAIILLVMKPWAGPGASDTPTDVADGYMSTTIDALNSGGFNIEAMAEDMRPYLCKEMQEDMDSGMEEADSSDMADLEELFAGAEFNVDYTLGEETIDGDSATVPATISGDATIDGTSTPMDQETDIELVKEDGVWKVCGGGLF